MFKKVKKDKVKARLRRARPNEDDEDQQEQSTMDAIEETRKKRKLMADVQYKRGLDATLKPVQKLPQQESASTSEQHAPNKEENVTDGLKGTFSGGTGGDTTSGEGVLERKHKKAMEEFIQKNLKHESQPKDNEAKISQSTAKDLETKLYAELASASCALTDKKEPAVEEGDVGAGGSMLGGTGIAEVALPSDYRLQTIQATEQATKATKRGSSVPPTTRDAGAERLSKSSISSSALPKAPEAGEVPPAPPMSKDDVSGVPASYSHNFQLHMKEWIQQKKDEEDAAQEPAHAPEDTHNDVEANRERQGFEAARRAAKGESDETTGKSPVKRSTDAKVWKKFMTKQRESRDRHS